MIAILILLWIIVLKLEQPFWVVVVAGIIFSPFIIIINKYLFRDKSRLLHLKIFDLPVKDFMTAWIAFWGLLGIAGGIIQVQRQISNQDKQLLHTRFSSGVELLGNQNESARIGGAYNLYFLASENPEYVEPVCEILCAHLRTITGKKEYREKYDEKSSNEIQTILDLLFKEKNGKLIFDKCKKNLRGVYFNGINLREATLSHVDFRVETILNDVDFADATLSHVDFAWGDNTLSNVAFFDATLSHVRFRQVSLNSVYFSEATLSGVEFSGVEFSSVSFYKSTLSEIKFWGGILSDVSFWDATLNNVDFSNAKFENHIDFRGTPLEGKTPEEITCYGCSGELTKSKEENK